MPAVCIEVFFYPYMPRIIFTKQPGAFINITHLLLLTAILSVFHGACFRGETSGAASDDEIVTAENNKESLPVPAAYPKALREWFAAPDGKPDGDGTITSPWDLATALDGNTVRGRVQPGDVINLRGGVYAGAFTSTIRGTANLPIQVRPYANERAVLDKKSADRENGTLNVRGAYVWFRDFEVTNSHAERKRLDPEGKLNPWRGSGINVWAGNTKYINLLIHDSGHGFGLWNEDGGTEIYGCLVFNNGNNKKEHGVYGHNKTGTQAIRDNIIFNGSGYGLHIYANSTKSSISGFEIEGNAVFNNGALTLDDQVADQILVGGVEGVAAARITLRENYIYNEPSAATAKNRGIRLGYENKFNEDVKLFDNYVYSRVPLKILWWNSIEARGNTIYSPATSVELLTPDGRNPTAYRWNANVYLNADRKQPVFQLNEQKLNFADWQANGFDRSGQSSPAFASSTRVFIRPNKYESGKANIVVYNPGLSPRIQVNLGGFLQAGEAFIVRDAQNYFGEPVLSGVYDGKAIQLPLDMSKTGKPVGNVERVPAHTGAGFGVFIIWKK
jgi:hypothetical protein